MTRLITALAMGVVSISALAQVPGKFGEGLRVGETYAAAAPNPVYTVMPLTVECWAKLSSKSAYNMLIANEPKNSVTHWELYADKGTGKLAAFLPGFKPDGVKSDVDVTDGQWHYLAMTCDGAMVKLYVDAKEVASAKLEKKFSYPDVGPLTFGHIEGVETAKDGAIDEVRISRVVRPIEKAPDAPFTADRDTVGLWHFDGDGKGGYADASTTKNVASVKPKAAKAAAGGAGTSGNKWAEMDCGPFFTSTLMIPTDKMNVAYKGISIRLGGDKKAAVCFDPETLRLTAGWTGGFVKIYPGRDGLAQPMDADGAVQFATAPGLGWAVGEKADFTDPRPDRMGPLAVEQGKYRGLYLNGTRVILSYSVGPVSVLETHDVEQADGVMAFARTIEINPRGQRVTLKLADVADADKSLIPNAEGFRPDTAYVQRKDGGLLAVHMVGATPETQLVNSDVGQLLLRVDPITQVTRVKLLTWSGPREAVARFFKLTDASPAAIELAQLTKGGPNRWGDPLVTKGTVGKGDQAYVVDTLTAPEDNPFKSFLRFGGHDFFKNGDMAICSVSGDVWVVSGIDDKLEKLTWRRFATGLHQPLGLRIIDDKVYVLGRDQITRLHDLNGDGEADFYECFNGGCKVTTNGHGYATNLETDPEGNFYYTKCADNTPFGGTVVKVSKDGKYAEPFAVGLRNPNGLGISPTGFITEADNQGEWVPASRIDFVEPGKFLGYKPMAKSAKATDMGQPICFMPQNIDNSSGGQVWAPADSDRWGPFGGDMLHTSYGAGTLLHVMMEKVGDTWQGGVTKFPLRFETGVMRGRFNSADGQLYVSGLRGWQTAGVKSGAVQRVRYTGKPVYMPKALHAHANGISITFAQPLDPTSAADAGNYSVLRWTYKWTGEYPSRHFSVADPKKQGYDTVEVKSAMLSKDGRTVFLEIPEIQPVKQQQVTIDVKAADGAAVQCEVYQTIHNLGKAYRE